MRFPDSGIHIVEESIVWQRNHLEGIAALGVAEPAAGSNGDWPDGALETGVELAAPVSPNAQCSERKLAERRRGGCVSAYPFSRATMRISCTNPAIAPMTIPTTVSQWVWNQ